MTTESTIDVTGAHPVRSSDWLGDASRLYALEVFREYRTALETADRADLEALAILLIQKRAVDGLNGRRWDAGAHLYFEDAVTSILAKVKSPNDQALRPARSPEQKGNDEK